MGYRISDRVQNISVGPPTPEEASALRVATVAEVIHLERIRLQDDIPLTYSTDAIPRSLFPGPISTYDWSLPLHQLLDGVGHTTFMSNTQIKAVHLPREVARRAGFPADVPCLLLVQTIISRSQVFLIYAHDYLRGDHFSFDVKRFRE